MNPKIKIAVIAAAVALAGVIIWAIFSVPQPPDSETAEKIKKEQIEKSNTMVYENNTIKEERDGKLFWEFSAKRTTLNTATKDAVSENIKGKFYAKSGVMIDGEADRAEYKGATGDLTLKGNAKFISSNGRRITADSITYRGSDQLIIAVGNVKIAIDQQ